MIMVTVWWLANGIIHYNFFDPGETIKEEKHCQEIDKMHQVLQHLHSTVVNWKEPILPHVNIYILMQPFLQVFSLKCFKILLNPPQKNTAFFFCVWGHYWTASKSAKIKVSDILLKKKRTPLRIFFPWIKINDQNS